MSLRFRTLCSVAGLSGLIVALFFAGDLSQAPRVVAGGGGPGSLAGKAPISGSPGAGSAVPLDVASKDGDRKADQDAILETTRVFARDFEKGDAKACAAHWTEQGEYHDDKGVNLRGRAAIEKAFAETFKTKSKTRMEVDVNSIRFPSRDTAIEEGILKHVSDGPDLPTSTFYRVWHVREAGQWKIALTREWGGNQDRLEDLAWLVGTWNAKAKNHEVTLSYSWDRTKPFMNGTFTKKTDGKIVSSGTLKIGFDINKGRLRSWHFDDDGGHGQSLWIRDGNRWVLDAAGTLADGTHTASLNIMTRKSSSEVFIRSIDRMIGDESLPDSLPIKFTRVAATK
jgi:uncharacterized protein (TIGR02246 family)